MLRGRLEEFNLAEVFGLIGDSRRSGALKVSREDSEGIIFFREGEVFFAITDKNRVPLGKRLVDAGLLTVKELNEALAEQKKTSHGLRLGQILIAKHYLNAETLELFVQEQILDALFEIMSWKEGEFEFAQNVSIEDEDIGIYMSTGDAIKGASERLEEWEKLLEMLPSSSAWLEMSAAPGRSKADIALKPDEWKIVYHLRQPKTVAELRRKIHLTSSSLFRTLARLLELELIEVAEAQPLPESLSETGESPEAFRPTVDLAVETTSSQEAGVSERKRGRLEQREHQEKHSHKYVIVSKSSTTKKPEEADVPIEWQAYYQAIAERLAKVQQGN